MPEDFQRIDDQISRAAFDLLLKEPFYAHVLAGMPRVYSDRVESIGLEWNDQQALLVVNPSWFQSQLIPSQHAIAIKHEVLHVVFRHIFRPAAYDPLLFSIAADLVVNQLLAPWKPLAGWPVLKMFPELKLKPDQTVEYYYAALAGLFRKMQGAEILENDASEGDFSAFKDMPMSAKALADLLEKRKKRGDDKGWHNGQDGLSAAAGRYSVGSLLIRARERMPPHQWGSLPAMLLSELNLILSERQPQVDWKRVVRIFCASSGRTKIRHTIKRVSKRYGTRPGIKVQRLQRLLVAVDTSGSIDQDMVELFFTEIHAAWKVGASVHVVECDAKIQRDYPYAGKPPQQVAGGGGTEFEPVFKWMRDQRRFDGCLYLTDGCGPPPKTPPVCKMIWVIAGSSNRKNLPFGPVVKIDEIPT